MLLTPAPRLVFPKQNDPGLSGNSIFCQAKTASLPTIDKAGSCGKQA